MKEQSYFITLKDFGRIFFRNKYKVILVGIIGLLIGLYISQFSKNEYVAQAEILIDTKNGNANDSTLQMMPTYKDLLLSKVTLESVKKKLDYDIGSKELRKMLDVKIEESSQVLTIFVNTENKNESLNLTNLFSEILKQEVQKYFKNTNVKILNSASITSETDKDVIVLIFSSIGFILFALFTYAIVLAKEVYFPKIDSIKKIEMLGQTALATISNGKKMNIAKNDFQLLASLLQKKVNHYPEVNLLIQRDIKKDTAAYGVAKSYELLNKKVLIVKLKNEKEQNSLAQQKWVEYVNFEEKIENLIEVSDYNTKTLTVDYMDTLDTMPLNEVLFERILKELKQEFDVMLFTSDISNKYYTFVLSQLMQNTIYIASSKKTSVNQADLDLKKLEQMNLEIIGMVLIQ